MAKNALYAQSGGVTAVINASACGVIETARRHPQQIARVYAGNNGIIGALTEDLIDTGQESDASIAALRHTPGSAFGSCRYKLRSFEENRREYERLVEVFQAHDIGYFFYNGGGDSQYTAHKVSQISEKMGYPITCIGIPKTVDNDLPFTDCSPGFGSVAKYVAVSIREGALDVASMCETSTKIFILEVMGRHAGWISAAGALARADGFPAPQVIVFPELPFEQEAFLEKVRRSVKQDGYCAIVVSEGAQRRDGTFLADAGGKDAFGHTQLGGVAPYLAQLIKRELGYKYHWALADYLQRSARHIASATDVEHAYAMGQAAVEFALAGKNAVMPTIVRQPGPAYAWTVGEAPLAEVANVEQRMPRDYISDCGFDVTDACLDYLRPLIQGEAYPPYENGIPVIARLHKTRVKKILNSHFSL